MLFEWVSYLFTVFFSEAFPKEGGGLLFKGGVLFGGVVWSSSLIASSGSPKRVFLAWGSLALKYFPEAFFQRWCVIPGRCVIWGVIWPSSLIRGALLSGDALLLGGTLFLGLHSY